MALEQMWVDDVGGSGSISALTTKTITIVPNYPHQPGRQVLITLAWVDINGTGAPITSVTVNGVAATLVCGIDNADISAAIYRCDNPPPGSYDVVATWADVVNGGMYVYQLEQADMSNPIKNSGTNSGTGTSSSIALGTVEVEELAFSVFAQYNTNTTTTCGTTAPFGADQNTNAGASPLRCRAISATALGTGASVTATHTPALSKKFAHAACVMRAANILPLRGIMGAGI